MLTNRAFAFIESFIQTGGGRDGERRPCLAGSYRSAQSTVCITLSAITFGVVAINEIARFVRCIGVQIAKQYGQIQIIIVLTTTALAAFLWTCQANIPSMTALYKMGGLLVING